MVQIEWTKLALLEFTYRQLAKNKTTNCDQRNWNTCGKLKKNANSTHCVQLVKSFKLINAYNLRWCICESDKRSSLLSLLSVRDMNADTTNFVIGYYYINNDYCCHGPLKEITSQKLFSCLSHINDDEMVYRIMFDAILQRGNQVCPFW